MITLFQRVRNVFVAGAFLSVAFSVTAPAQVLANTGSAIVNFAIVGADPGSNGKVKTVNAGESVRLQATIKGNYAAQYCTFFQKNGSWKKGVEKAYKGGVRYADTPPVTKETTFVLHCYDESYDPLIPTPVTKGTAEVTVKIKTGSDQPGSSNGVITKFAIVGADPGSNGTVKTIVSGESVKLVTEIRNRSTKYYPDGEIACNIKSSTSGWNARDIKDWRRNYKKGIKYVNTHPITKDTVFTFRCVEQGGYDVPEPDVEVGTATVTVKIGRQNEIKKPVISKFIAETEKVKKGFPVRLSWKSQNADACGLVSEERTILNKAARFFGFRGASGGTVEKFDLPVEADGHVALDKIEKDTEFTLQCKRGEGDKLVYSDKMTLTVRVSRELPAPKILSLSMFHPQAVETSAEKIVLPRGAEGLKMYWGSQNADKCTAKILTADNKRPLNMDKTIADLENIPTGNSTTGFIFSEPINESLRLDLICFQDVSGSGARRDTKTFFIELQKIDDGGCIFEDGKAKCGGEDEAEKKASLRVSFSAAAGGDTQTVKSGERARFKVAVENDGQVNLKDVKVDATINSCRRTVEQTKEMYEGDLLDVGEKFTFECAQPFEKSATVTITVSAQSTDGKLKVEGVSDTTEVTVENVVDDSQDQSNDQNNQNNDQDNQNNNQDQSNNQDSQNNQNNRNNDQDNQNDDQDNTQLSTSCSEQIDVRTAYERATAVFAGKLVKMRKLGAFHPAKLFGYRTELVFAVDEDDPFWKGKRRKLVSVRVKDKTVFEQGEAYLVYASRSAGAFGYYTSPCLRTKLYDLASEDIATLNDLVSEEELSEAYVRFVTGSADKTEVLPAKITAPAGRFVLTAAAANAGSCRLTANGVPVSDGETAAGNAAGQQARLLVYTFDLNADTEFVISCVGLSGSDKEGKTLTDKVKVKVRGQTEQTGDTGAEPFVMFISGVDEQGRPEEVEELSVSFGENFELNWIAGNVENCALYRKVTGEMVAASTSYKLQEVASSGSYRAKAVGDALFTLRCAVIGSDRTIEDSLKLSLIESEQVGEQTEKESEESETAQAKNDKKSDTRSNTEEKSGTGSVSDDEQEVCTSQYEPVCAKLPSSGRLHTFGNACEARRSNAEIQFEGICGRGGQKNNGTQCPAVSVPMCDKGSEYVEGGKDENGCPLPGKCVPRSSASAEVDQEVRDSLVEPADPEYVREVFIPCSFAWPDSLTDKFAQPKDIFGFGATNNVIGRIQCQLENKVRIIAGQKDNNRYYTWKKAYYTEDGLRFTKSVELEGKTDSTGRWIVGEARADFVFDGDVSKDNYVATYTCVYTDEGWKCGCKSATECSDPSAGKTIWYLNAFNLSRR